MKELKKYVATYHYGKKIQGITLKATDELDAKRRIKAIRRNNLRFQGEATKRVDTRKHTLSDFVWFGRMIEKFSVLHDKIESYYQMQNCSAPKSYAMSQNTSQRFIEIATAYPDLIPLKLSSLSIVSAYMPDDAIGHSV